MPKPTSIPRFARALRQAIHDHDHEVSEVSAVEPRPTTHYWDTDSIFWPSFGFLGEEWRDQSTSINRTHADQDRLVQALFSAGLLGQVRMLSAHRSEYEGLLRAWSSRHVAGRHAYRHELQKYVAVHELDPVLRTLRNGPSFDPLRASARDPRETLDALRALPSTVFVEVESLSGPWEQRIRRLADTGLLDAAGDAPSTDQIIESPLFVRFVDEIGRLRDDARRGAATVIDAAAMTSLAIMNAAAVAGVAPRYPRFYTSSITLKRLYSLQWVKDALRFNFTTRHGRAAIGTVWRDSYYYLVRAVFPSLAMPGAKQPFYSEGPDIDELRYLSRLLNGILDGNASSDPHAFAAIPAEDAELVQQKIDAVESSGISMAWLRYRADPIVSEMLAGVRAISELSTVELTQELAASFIVDSARALRTSVSELRLQAHLPLAVSRAWGRVSHANQRKSLTLLYDLGAIRWGLRPGMQRGVVELDVGGAQVARRGLAFSGDSRRPMRDVLLFHDVGGMLRDPNASERAAVILAALGLFGPLYELCSAVAAERYRAHRSLELLRRYAIIRLEYFSSSSELRECIEGLQAEFVRLNQSDRVRYCLGYAHAVYWGWKVGRFAGHQVEGMASSDAVERVPLDPYSWAQWSRSIVEDSYPQFSPLQMEFGSNHIVRVATEAGLDEGSVRPHLDLLLTKVANSSPNFRLWDTLGYREYLFALRSYPEGGRFQASEFVLWARSNRGRLQGSVDLLEAGAFRSPRDPELRNHLRSAGVLLAEAGGVYGS